MTVNAQTNPRKRFVPQLLPWLLAVVALTLYGLTLNHWVSLYNLTTVAKISGWTIGSEIYQPVSFVVTYPFRWLPASQIPLALNLFSAVCAALTLGLLARSVALLPHDRTDAQRKREPGPHALLTIRSAWLPPVFAVAACGLQLSFWEHATNHAGDMLNLLLFALVIWSLLEYRLDEREGRLFLAAFVYGAGMTDDWAMVCFSPVFLTALIWIRGLSFFKLQFLTRMLFCGLVGMLFYLLLPLAAVISGKVPVTFWEALRMNLASQFFVVGAFFNNGNVRQTLELLSLSSLAPVLLLAIRWHSSFGDTSQLGRALASFLFHLVHAVILIICIWVAFDPPFSPREKGMGLTLYYLSALSVGYYSGYFLLVFRNETGTRFQQRDAAPFNFLNFLAVGFVWLLFLSAGAGLIYKNTPQIRATNDDTLPRYASLAVENLPPPGGILLSDDPQRLYLTEAALVRDGRAKDFVFLDTQFLVWPAYHKILHARYPRQFPNTVGAAETNSISPLRISTLLGALAKTNELYYLHPSFGYYFEQFYLEPHGLVYKLKTLPADTLIPPLPDTAEIAENEAFWSHAEIQVFAPIESALAAPKSDEDQTRVESLLAALHVPHEENPNAVVAGGFCSRSLDYWGVQLQRAGALIIAAEHFKMAQKLNPENTVAQINLQFNHSLQSGEEVPVDLGKITFEQFGRYRSWSSVLGVYGPFDEPSFCFANGLVWLQNQFYHQALAEFTRVCQLAPDNLSARFELAELYVFNHLPDRALAAIQDIRLQPEKFPLDDKTKMQLAIVGTAAYFQQGDLVQGTQSLETEISRNPTNDVLLATAVQFYMANGLATNALAVIDSRLRISPDDASWLFSQSLVYLQLKDYDRAINVLNHVLSLQASNSTARFNRAIAYLNSGRLNEARADYKELSQTYTNSYRIDYGLGEIAWRQHETNDAIKFYKLYLANATTNTAEATNVIERLRQLRGKSP